MLTDSVYCRQQGVKESAVEAAVLREVALFWAVLVLDGELDAFVRLTPEMKPSQILGHLLQALLH